MASMTGADQAEGRKQVQKRLSQDRVGLYPSASLTPRIPGFDPKAMEEEQRMALRLSVDMGAKTEAAARVEMVV